MLDPRQQAFVTGFKAEHRELHAVLRRVDDAWKACDAGDWRERDQRRLCDAMLGLRKHLEHHFKQEEAGGYMEEALLLAPRLATTTDILLAQHPVLWRDCTATAEQLRLAPIDGERRQRLRAEFRDLRQRLLEHERAENAVMQAAYHVDLEAV